MKWFRFSLFLLLSLFGLSMAFSFNANLLESQARLVFLGKFLHPFVAWGILSYLLLWFQKNGDRFGRWLATAGINSYGAYVIHSLILVIVLMAVGFIGINPWLIVMISTLFSILISFGLAGQLRRVPAVAKILWPSKTSSSTPRQQWRGFLLPVPRDKKHLSPSVKRVLRRGVFSVPPSRSLRPWSRHSGLWSHSLSKHQGDTWQWVRTHANSW